MAETITPVVHGGDRRRYWVAVALHSSASAASAALVGAALGALGWMLGAPWGAGGLVALAAVAAIYVLREVAGVPVPLPDAHRQVPEWWRTFFSPNTTAVLYGLGLGLGFYTFLRFGTYVAVAFAALSSGNPALGLVLCAPFGLARGLSVAVSSGLTSGGRAGDKVNARLERLAAGPGPGWVNAAALTTVSLSSLALSVL